MNSAGILAGEGVRVFPSPPLSFIFSFYGCIAAAVVLKHRLAKYFLSGAAVVLLVVILTPSAPKPTGEFQIHFLDVGQGDAIVLQYPDGSFDLVDGGGFFNSEALDTGEAILLPYLCRLRVTRLHRVFLTHAHADHMNGLASLMRYIPVEEFYVTRQPVGEKTYQDFLRTINRTPLTVAAGMGFKQAGVTLQVFLPDDSRKTLRVANDDSLVLLVEYQGKRILLTGDLEREGEEKLCHRIKSTVDYIKVPHHGSKSSSSPILLETIRARGAFISVGSNNWYGHPHPSVLQRYRKHHVMLYRTDHHGTVILRISNGQAFVTAAF